MDLGLEGKVAAVGGASAGLGKAVAWALAREGARVSICARDTDRLERAREALRRASGREIFAHAADLSTEQGPGEFIEATTREFGSLDILVCNAGGPPPTTVATTPPEAWQEAVDLSLLSTVRLVQAAIPHMRRRERGRIIAITSISVKTPIEGLVLSNTARPGVVGFTKSVANEFGHDGITANVVCPGYMLTDRLQQLIEERANAEERTPEEIAQEMTQGVPVGRMGDPKELADLVAFLASDRAGYITGTTIQVDGGFIKSIP